MSCVIIHLETDYETQLKASELSEIVQLYKGKSK